LITLDNCMLATDAVNKSRPAAHAQMTSSLHAGHRHSARSHIPPHTELVKIMISVTDQSIEAHFRAEKC